MSQLCFATFARALQKVLIQPAPAYNTPTSQGKKKPSTARQRMTSTDAHIVEELLRWIHDVMPIEARDGTEVWRTSKTVSGLMNQDIDLHTGFAPVLLDPELPNAGVRAFAKIKTSILPTRKADFIAELVDLIKNDPEISAASAEELLRAIEVSEENFYAKTFLYAISKPNRKREESTVLTEQGILLAARNRDKCPLCKTERLFKEVKGQRHPLFEVVHFPAEEGSTKHVSEAVCVKCAKLAAGSQGLFTDEATLEALRKIHARKQASKAIEDEVIDAQLHPEIIKVINELGEQLKSGSAVELKMDALRIDSKIRREEYSELAERIMFHVLRWYRVVEEDFQKLDASGRNRFKFIAEQVADFYISVKEKTDDQQQIFDAVAEWIHEKSNFTNRNAAIVITSFFVQNCEVFDEIA